MSSCNQVVLFASECKLVIRAPTITTNSYSKLFLTKLSGIDLPENWVNLSIKGHGWVSTYMVVRMSNLKGHFRDNIYFCSKMTLKFYNRKIVSNWFFPLFQSFCGKKNSAIGWDNVSGYWEWGRSTITWHLAYSHMDHLDIWVLCGHESLEKEQF